MEWGSNGEDLEGRTRQGIAGIANANANANANLNPNPNPNPNRGGIAGTIKATITVRSELGLALGVGL